MNERISRPTDYFGANLASLLAEKIKHEYPGFEAKLFSAYIKKHCTDKSLKQRVELIADTLHDFLPAHYKKSMKILTGIMGPENPNETGMFKQYYWLMPIGKFIEKYGLEDFNTSISAIEHLTKRNTGEYAIRPFIKKYPTDTLQQMSTWAVSENFHLRRLAAEGLRPKLPWAQKLDLFIENPKPVFNILNKLRKEPVMFVKKSVANNLADYIKVNPEPTFRFLNTWEKEKNENTQWMVRYATRKLK